MRSVFLAVESPEQYNSIQGRGDLSPFDRESLRRHSPDAHWLMLDSRGRARGRCSLWWSHVPLYPRHRLGVIGHFAVDSRETASALLSHACRQLADRGCTLAVGPMDGSTWRSYRFVTQRGSAPPFFLEPNHPPEWPEHFTQFGFTPLAQYISNLNHDLNQEDRRGRECETRFHEMGVHIRLIDLERFEDELRSIYAIAARSFTHSFLSTPISEREFVECHLPLKPYIRPELVMFAERENRAVGFVFTIPDWLQAERRVEIDTVIIKTLAVLPGRAYAGLGSRLVCRNQTMARELGYRHAIHALMHTANCSGAISRRYGNTMRRYTLFARVLR